MVEEFLWEMYQSSRPFNDFALELLRHILACNIFVFWDVYCLQVQGVTMGVCCASSLTCTGGGMGEKTVLGQFGIYVSVSCVGTST